MGVMQGTHLFRPTKNGEWPETRGEPGIQNVLILLKGEFASSSFRFGFRLSLFRRTGDDPIVIVRSLSVSPAYRRTTR